MSTTQAKPPTPQGVSAKLRQAGFTKSESSASRIKGWRNHSPGYVVRRGTKDGTVEVFYETGSFRMDDRDREWAAAKHAEYAAVLESAGYTIRPDKNWRGGLIIGVKESAQ